MASTLLERLHNKYIVAADGCWNWQGAKRGEYGVIQTGSVKDGSRRMSPAHRVMLEVTTGRIVPGELEVDHLCKNKSCVNPDHMEPVTPKVNKLRADGFAGLNARKDSCKEGHPFDAVNTRIDYRGHRRCRTCDNKWGRDRTARAVTERGEG